MRYLLGVTASIRSLAISAALVAGAALVACDSAPVAAPDDAGLPATAAAPVPARPANAEHGWNDTQIGWVPYEAGLARAKAEGKPVCLVVYTTWCPHCRNYSKVFDDPRVVERSKSFVMIRMDADVEKDAATKFSPDGGYIPRTFFLASDGTLKADIQAPRPRFKYFYDERDPASLLAGMDQALKVAKN